MSHVKESVYFKEEHFAIEHVSHRMVQRFSESIIHIIGQTGLKSAVQNSYGLAIDIDQTYSDGCQPITVAPPAIHERVASLNKKSIVYLAFLKKTLYEDHIRDENLLGFTQTSKKISNNPLHPNQYIDGIYVVSDIAITAKGRDVLPEHISIGLLHSALRQKKDKQKHHTVTIDVNSEDAIGLARYLEWGFRETRSKDTTAQTHTLENNPIRIKGKVKYILSHLENTYEWLHDDSVLRYSR